MLNDSNASILSRWFSRKSGKKPKSSRCTKPLLEFLEDRTAPATLSEVGGTLTINLDNAGEQLRVVSNGVTYALTSNFNFVNDGTNPVTTAPPTDFVTGFGTMTASVTAAGLMAYDTINVVDSAQNTSVRFNGGDYQDDFTITLDDDTDVGVGELASVSFNNATNFGSADVTISTTRNVQFAPANLTIVTFTSGNLDIEANTAGTTTGDFNGIQLSSTTIDSTSGNITMEGHGGTAAGNQDGVSINGTPITTTSGAITLNGTATGNNTGSGVRIFNGADLTTDTGAVLITGNSEGDAGIILTGASSANLATIMTSATTAGQGNITLLGAGEGGVALSDAELTTDAGQIQVTGNADTVTDGNQGITIFGNSVLTTIGTGANAGNIILNGTGGTPPIMGASASGISIGNIGSDSLTITTVDGDISFTGNATRDAGVTYNRGQIIESTGAGSITFMGTAMTAEANFGVFVAAPVATNSGTIMITGSSEGPATGDTGVSIVDMVTSTTGAIVIDGTADNTNGVSLLGTSGTEVSTGGTTGISITGTSNSATPTDAGVFLAGNPLVTTSTNAPINIVGNGPLGLVMGNPMSFTPGAPMITSTGGGDITISGDDVQMNNNAEINTPGTVRMAITGDVTQDISGAGFLDPRFISPSLGITATGNVDLQRMNQVDTLGI
ncbi:MAG: beta strand repeat-containing protein, partial [Gemmataceae bacterium]